MPNRIPVIDDWGNQVGEFIPTGGDGLETIVGVIAVVIVLSVVGFPLYLIYKLIAYAIEEAREGKWIAAILLVIVLILTTGGIVIAIVTSSLSEVEVRQSTMDETLNNVNVISVIDKPISRNGRVWDFLIKIHDNGPYKTLIDYVSNSPTSEPWTSECFITDNGHLWEGPIPYPGQVVWYVCKFKGAHNVSDLKTSWGIRVSMFENFASDPRVGVGWKKIR